MEWLETVSILLLSVGAFAWATALERRPVDLMRPRMAPTFLIRAVSAVAILLMLAHILSLATGRPFQGGSPW